MVDSERFYDGSSLAALRVDADDPEVARARAAVQERLLGVPAAPVRIGRFVVLERIGAGGMGIVYSAYDPQLDRKVAIKLLFERGASARQRARVVREAKAMAKLAHPNVVHVYEVGEHGGRLFLAMEYVRGQTLRAWWNARERTIRERLAMCLQAGRGLAAAHAAGIVHGDFKPDNVLIGEDDRARVLDFGLARIVEAPSTGDDAASDDTLPLPPRRMLTEGQMGTPAYAAPEQLRGLAPDPRSDQFSFCVTVWEAFSGVLPFAADPERLRSATDPLPIRAVARAKMPAWIEVALRRGLAVDRRWSSMDELLHELARDPSIVRNRRVGAVAVVAAIGMAFAIGATTQGAAVHDPCGGGQLAIEAAWPAEARATTIRRIAAADEYGEALAPELSSRLDDYASRWTAAHREACEAHRRGEQSSELLDRRVTCLDRGRVSLETLGRIARDREPGQLSSLANAIASLPSPDTCGDLDHLGSIREPLPAELRPLADRVQTEWVRFAAGEYDQVRANMPELIADVRAAENRPLLAEALHVYGVTMLEDTDRSKIAAVFREASELALASGNDEIAIHAWSQRVWASGTGRTEDPDALHAFELMEAFAEGRGRPTTVAAFHANVGGAKMGLGRREEARRHFERSLELARQLGPEGAARLGASAGNLAVVADDPEVRDELLAESIDAYTRAYGAEHPRTLMARASRAALTAGDPLPALVAACDDFWRLHPQLRDDVRQCEGELAVVADRAGDVERAKLAVERMLVLAPADELPNVWPWVRWWRGDADGAAALAAPIVEAFPVPGEGGLRWFEEVDHGELELVLGRAWRAIGDPRADRMLGRALARFEIAAEVQPTPPMVRRRDFAQQLLDDPTAH